MMKRGCPVGTATWPASLLTVRTAVDTCLPLQDGTLAGQPRRTRLARRPPGPARPRAGRTRADGCVMPPSHQRTNLVSKRPILRDVRIVASGRPPRTPRVTAQTVLRRPAPGDSRMGGRAFAHRPRPNTIRQPYRAPGVT